MTALAELLVGTGKRVTGSDTTEVFYTDAILRRLQIAVAMPFDVQNIPPDTQAFVYSTAYTKENNAELRAAWESGKPVLSYPAALGALTEEKMTLAVCGTHGKTTTSALLAETLCVAGLDPSAIIGSEVSKWSGAALSGQGPHLVIEADEYQNKLALYQPFGVILTSVDWDHPDFFPTVESYEQVFRDFVARIPRHGFAIVCSDHARAEYLTREIPNRITYGLLEGAAVRGVDLRILPESDRRTGILQEFFVEYEGNRTGPYQLRLAGQHNVENALAVIATGFKLKLKDEQVMQALATFSGTKRRFEFIGEWNGALIYDDYAHHPAEIKATLSAIRALYPTRRLFVIFHPHTFTRTKALLEDFAESFERADGVVVLDIYGSAREVQGGVSSQDLVDRINSFAPERAAYATDRKVLVAEMTTSMSDNDIIITMGAGDVWQLAEKMLKG